MDIHRPALCTLYNTHTHTLQIYDTLQNSVAWASAHEHRTSLPYFKASSLRILMPDPRPFKTHSNSFPLTFAWLTSCTSTHAEKYFSNSFCHHSFFLSPHTGILSNYCRHHPFLCDPMAHLLQTTPSLFQKLHLSKVLLLLSTLQMTKSKNKQTKNIQYCVNKETTIICRLYGECDRCVKCFETSWPSQSWHADSLGSSHTASLHKSRKKFIKKNDEDCIKSSS